MMALVCRTGRPRPGYPPAMVAHAGRAHAPYIAASLWMWAIVLVGFWPSYFGPALAGSVEKTAVVHVHAAVYLGWMVLYTVQSTLPALGRTRLHRKVGRFGVAYGVALFVTGVLVSFESYFRTLGDGPVDTAARRALLNPLSDMVVFPVLFGLALRYRRRPETHKRLMVLATTMLLIAAVFRMRFLDPTNVLLVAAVWLSPAWLLALRDGLAERRLHPVYGFGLPLLALVPARNLFVDSAPWRAFTDAVASAEGLAGVFRALP